MAAVLGAYSHSHFQSLPPLAEEERRFASRLYHELGTLGRAAHLGLARYPGDAFEGSRETTQGHASIRLKPADVRMWRLALRFVFAAASG